MLLGQKAGLVELERSGRRKRQRVRDSGRDRADVLAMTPAQTACPPPPPAWLPRERKTSTAAAGARTGPLQRRVDSRGRAPANGQCRGRPALRSRPGPGSWNAGAAGRSSSLAGDGNAEIRRTSNGPAVLVAKRALIRRPLSVPAPRPPTRRLRVGTRSCADRSPAISLPSIVALGQHGKLIA